MPNHKDNIWQHFQGIEIETQKNFFDDEVEKKYWEKIFNGVANNSLDSPRL